MNQQTASRETSDPPAQLTSAGVRLELRPAVRPQLTDEQRRVLHCLGKDGGRLTARQLEARSACTAEQLDLALAGLLELKLVARLNTIVPSYMTRMPSPAGDDH